MKILHLIDEPWDSGLTHYAVQIADALVRSGHEVILGVLSGRKPEQLARDQKIPTTSVDSILKLRRLIRNKRWDVINVHTGRMHSWSLVLAPASIPIVRTRGDARPVRVNPLSRFIYRRTAAIVAASDHIARYYEEDFDLKHAQLNVIYPSVDPSPPSSPPADDRVGILARLDPVKGHAVFLEAAAYVLKKWPQAKFIIAGKEANIRYDLLRNQIEQLGMEQAVSYVGFQNSSRQFMSGCSIGVIASIGSEEISRVCLEWMAVGRPVVGTLVGCLPELIEPQETGFLVAPGDGVALGEAILRLLNDPERAQTLGKNAQRLIGQKFNSAVQLEKTLAVYRYAIEHTGLSTRLSTESTNRPGVSRS